MNNDPPVIEIDSLVRRFGKTDAVNGLSLTVRAGRCYGFLGRNGAGKTTTIKCMLNLLRPTSGSVRLFGLDPARDEAAVKSRIGYVPDTVAYYPWMRVRDYLEYLASFRARWSGRIESELLERFRLEPGQKANTLSKGQKTQLALIGAICPEPELLILDEPTSGLDPLVRRELIQTVIGAYHAGAGSAMEGGMGGTDALASGKSAPANRTVFVSTHLISEFEGLIDEFAIIDQGRAVLTLEADQAREQFKKIRARFSEPQPALDLAAALHVRKSGRDLELLVNGRADEILAAIQAARPEALGVESLSLEEIFLASCRKEIAAYENALG